MSLIRAVVLFGVCLALTAIVVFSWLSSPPVAPESGGGEPLTWGAEAAAGPTETGQGDPAVRDPVEPAAEQSEEPSTDRRWLRIVDQNGVPLPGADYFEGAEPYSSTAGLLECEAWRQQWRPDSWLELRCSRQVADVGGYVEPHTTDVPKLYVARYEGRLGFWGFGFWGSSFPSELLVSPARTCTVCVLDAAGQPVVGAAVVLRDDAEPAHSRTPIVGVTCEDGTCIVPFMERLGALVDDGRFLPRLGVRGLGLRSADVEFHPESLPRDLTIKLPPCGSVALEWVDAQGLRLASPEPVILLGPDGEELAEFTRPDRPIEFGLCAVGMTIAVNYADGYRFAGPKSMGERVAERLRMTDLEPGGWVLTGRALHEGGTPLANCELHARSGFDSFAAGPVVTTASGRFAFVLAEDDADILRDDDGFGVVHCELKSGVGLVDRRGAFVPLSSPLPPGIVNLGDVVLQDTVVLARGRVRSAAGPVNGAWVRTTYFGQGLDTSIDPDGRFVVTGLPGRTIRLQAGADGFFSQKITESPYGDDLDVVLEASGRAGALVLVDPEFDDHCESLRFELINSRGIRHRADASVSQAGTIECRWVVPPGSYRCEVRTFAEADPLAVVPCLVVEPNSDMLAHPEQIDLRGRLRAARISWVDEHDEPLHLSWGARVYVPGTLAEVDGKRVWDSIDGGGGGCWLLGTGAPVTIAVEDGEFAGTWSGPLADARVTVRPVSTVRFRIPGLPPAPEGNKWQLCAYARGGNATIRLRVDDRLERRDCGSTWVDVEDDGTGTLALAPDSRYEIELLFDPGESSTRRSRSLDASSGEVVLGATLPEELVFEFVRQQVQEAIR